MSTWGKDFYDNPLKQRVREELWLPCFEEIIPQIREEWKDRRAIRYLCLPGAKCKFIKELITRNILTRESYVIGIEKKRAVCPQINRFFGNQFNHKNFKIYQGLFQMICYNENFCAKFPFDIANLDITGSYHTVLPNGTSVYYQGLQQFMAVQASKVAMEPYKITKFFLIITSNLKMGKIPEKFLQMYDGNLTTYLINEVLNDYIENFQLEADFISSLIDSDEEQEEFFSEKISIMSIIVRIMNLCSDYFLVSMKGVPYCYRGHVGGAPIVSMVFLCEKKNPVTGMNGQINKLRIKNMNDAIKQGSNINFL